MNSLLIGCVAAKKLTAAIAESSKGLQSRALSSSRGGVGKAGLPTPWHTTWNGSWRGRAKFGRDFDNDGSLERKRNKLL